MLSCAVSTNANAIDARAKSAHLRDHLGHVALLGVGDASTPLRECVASLGRDGGGENAGHLPGVVHAVEGEDRGLHEGIRVLWGSNMLHE